MQLGDILLEGGLVSRDPARRLPTRSSSGSGAASAGCWSTRACSPSPSSSPRWPQQIGLRVRRPQRVRRRRLGDRPGPRRRLPPARRAADRLTRTASWSSRWPTRRTSSRSTTSARSPAWTSARSSPPRAESLAAIDRFYRADADVDDLTQRRWTTADEDDDLSKVKEIVEDAPIVKFVNLLITQAIQDRASDIHVEPTEHDLRIRFRIDGVLHEVMRSPKAIQAGVISRLKIMADINIAERRIPQDGRISVNANGKKIDLRVATLPTVYGEKVVMRILDNSTARLDLADLGFCRGNYERYSKSFTKPYGTILVTGPDRFGQVDDAVRDAQHRQPARGQRHHGRGPGRVPAARHQPGADQPQGRADLRRRRCARSCGPTPTSCSSVRSATTRRRRSRSRPRSPVTSCSRRCTPTTPRRAAPGSPRWASSRSSSARRSTACSPSGSPAGCATKCKEAYQPTPEALVEARLPVGRRASRARRCTAPVGCSACAKTGYKGRLALHEVMAVSEEIERLDRRARLGRRRSREVARARAWSRCATTACARSRQGVTSLEEILRVVV